VNERLKNGALFDSSATIHENFGAGLVASTKRFAGSRPQERGMKEFFLAVRRSPGAMRRYG
jgi:hypothetical protein